MPYQSEIEKLEQRFREKPEQWFAALADAYRKAGEVERALDVVRAGLEKRPNYTSGHIVLGRCLLDQLNDPEAAQAFERVLQLDAENIIALKSLSEIAERQGDGGAARRWLDRLLEVDPMNDEARAALEALEADAVGAPAEEPVYEASRWEEPERPVESVDAGSTVEVEEHRVPVSEAPTGPTEAIDIDDRDVEEAMEEEELELETPELAAKISDEFPVPDFDVEGPAGPVFPAPTEPTFEEPALDELEVERAAQPEGEVPTIEMEPVSVEHVSEADRGVAEPEVVSAEQLAEFEPAEPEVVSEEQLAELEPAEPIWAQDAVDVVEEPLDVTPFDEELAWDAGERLSQQITQEDLDEAERAHEESLEAAARYLPGLEHTEVPDLAGPALEGVEGTEEPAEAEAESQEALDAGVDAEQLPDAEPPFEEVVAGEFVDESWEADEFEVPTLDLVAPEPPASEETLESVPPEGGEAPGWEPEPPRLAAEAAPLLGETEEAAPDVSMQPAPEMTGAEPLAEEAVSAPLEPSTPEGDLEEAAAAGPAPPVDLPLIMPDETGEEDRHKEEPEPEPVLTETMAEVYARQGLFGEARHIYEQLLARRPGDAELERRIAELDARVTPARHGLREALADRFAASATGGQSLRDMLSEIVRAGRGSDFVSAPRDEMPPQLPEEYAPSAAPEESPVESALGAAFEEESDGPPDVSSSPDDAEVSLASVFGEEPVPTSPSQSAPPAPAQPPSPAEPSPYDEFFGGGTRAPQPDSEPPAEEASSEGEDGEQDFRDWLQGLKS